MSRLDDLRSAAKDAAPGAALGGADTGASQSATVLQGPTPKRILKDPYAAWGAPTSDPQVRLVIYARKFYMMPRYDVLYDVFFDGSYKFVGLIFPHHRVSIYGQNLQELVNALRINSVEWIREFIFSLHELPPDEDGTLPIISSIEVDHVQNPFEADLSPQPSPAHAGS
ncbi:MAG: hypothetical protein JOZ57_00785 [Abitibacteriaceae bacterium]|nr:hypothetical protein [Abditibacteriaceae bacterium]